jgi:hypothetical protein
MRDPYTCGQCVRRFRSLEAFDSHRVGEFTQAGPSYGRSCTDPSPRRFQLNAHGEWARVEDTSRRTPPHWRARAAV